MMDTQGLKSSPETIKIIEEENRELDNLEPQEIPLTSETVAQLRDAISIQPGKTRLTAKVGTRPSCHETQRKQLIRWAIYTLQQEGLNFGLDALESKIYSIITTESSRPTAEQLYYVNIPEKKVIWDSYTIYISNETYINL